MKILISQKKYSDDIFWISVKIISKKRSPHLVIHEVAVLNSKKIPIRIIKSKSNNAIFFNSFKNVFSLRRIFSFSFTMIVAVLFIASFATVGFLVMPNTKVNTPFVIKDAVVKQVSQIIAGQPIHYTVLVKRSSVTPQHYLLPIPKSATNIRIGNIIANYVQPIASKEVAHQYLIVTQKGDFINFSEPTYASSVLAHVTKSIFAEALTTDASGADLVAPDASQAPAQDKISSSSDNVSGAEVQFVSVAPVEDSTPLPNPSTSIDMTSIPAIPSDTSSSDLTPVLPPTPQISSSGDTSVADQVQQPSSQTVPDSQLAPQDQSQDQSTAQSPDSSSSSNSVSSDSVQVSYQVPGPLITQQDTDSGKLVVVSVPDLQDETTPLLDVLAYAKIPEIFKVGDENKIQITWQNNNNQTMPFTARDTDGNGYLDYVEWTVPHLSTQTFAVTFVSKAFQLDENKNIVADIYDKVKSENGDYVSVQNGQYIRVTFQKILQNNNTISLYAKLADASQPANIEVYPVYDNQSLENQSVAAFEQFDAIGAYYKVTLTNLLQPTNIFEFKVIGSVDIDYIVDPIPLTSETNPLLPVIMQQSIFSEAEQSSVLVKPFFADGSTNIAFYIPYGTPPVWTWQSETPAIGSLPFSDYWAPTPAPGNYTAVEYFNDHQQFSCSDLSLEDCINDPHFVSQYTFTISQ